MCDFKKNLDSRHININGIIISGKENSKEALKRHLFFYECPSALEEKMGMTGVEPACHGLKARCIAVLLHTPMSHAGFEPTLED